MSRRAFRAARAASRNAIVVVTACSNIDPLLVREGRADGVGVVAFGPGGEFVPEVDERPHRQELPHRFLDRVAGVRMRVGWGASSSQSSRARPRVSARPLQVRRPCRVFEFPKARGACRGGVADARRLCRVGGEGVEFGEGLRGADALLRPGDRLARIDPIKLLPRPFPDVVGLGEVGGDLLQLVDAFQRGVGVAASDHERRLLAGLPDVHG